MFYSYSAYSDEKLIELLQSSDENAFNELFERYKERLFNYIVSIIKSSEISEEIVIDIFVKIWTGKELFRHVNDFEAFLLTVAKNKSFDFLRTTSRQYRLMEMYKELYLNENTVKSGDELLIDREMSEIWKQAINRLPEQRKKIFLLNKEEGLTYEEIALALNLSKNTVKTSLSIAKRSVVDFLRHHPSSKAAFCLLFLF